MAKGIGMLALMVVGMAVLVLGAWNYDTSHTDGEVVAAETAIKTDVDAQLPKGSSPAEVEKFLDAHGVTEHQFFNAHAPMDAFQGGSAVEAASSAPYGNMMHECRLLWAFYFDDSGRLLNYRDDALCKSNLTAGTRDPGQPMRPRVDVAPKSPKFE
jgi:hypothetical protein